MEIPAPQGLFQGMNTRNCLREASEEVLEQKVPEESQTARTAWGSDKNSRRIKPATSSSVEPQMGVEGDTCGTEPYKVLCGQCHTKQLGRLQRGAEQTPGGREFVKKVPEIFWRGESGLSDFGEIFEVVEGNVEGYVDTTMSLDLCARVPQERLLC
ncbi:hypothetical protein DUI87_31977 [Hirundo rustica rustica]|uniref:Uncharacterized protein n=1 Tax=Hirundo rustica rustica TaxID=333673 RepID=A0A3M0IS97_HIRRU|nr:hypothetical protein DUI87_31977 [Hirundo rustica rustica]